MEVLTINSKNAVNVEMLEKNYNYQKAYISVIVAT